MTFNELRLLAGLPSISESFPPELQEIGNLVGALPSAPAMLPLNKLIVESRLQQLRRDGSAMFSPEVREKVTVSVILKTALVSNEAFNELLAHAFRTYLHLAE